MDIITNIITKRPSICKYGKAQIYVCTFQEIFEFADILHLPDIQGDLNQDKVDEMISSYKKNHHFMASKALITITKISIADQVQYGLVDGQHRLEMIKQIYDSDKVPDQILIAIINVESQEELDDLFLEINIDSSKCIYKNLTIFDKKSYEDLKKKINDDASLSPLKISRYSSNVYTTTQFVSHLIYNQIIEKLREKNLIENNATSILDFLKLKEKEFFNSYKYDSKKLDKLKFLKDEMEQINLKSCMFMKNNNFLDWIFDDTIEPEHDFNPRPAIKPKLRKEVWDTQYEKLKSHLCPIIGCENIMNVNDSETWHCGHVISHSNKGVTDITNLKPICPHCNKRMNYRNWEEWENEEINNIILKENFNNCKQTKCKNGECKNKINKKTFKAQIYNNNTVEPWCEKCFNKFNEPEPETKIEGKIIETKQKINKEIIIDTDSDEIIITNVIKKKSKSTNKKKKNKRIKQNQKSIDV